MKSVNTPQATETPTRVQQRTALSRRELLNSRLTVSAKETFAIQCDKMKRTCAAYSAWYRPVRPFLKIIARLYTHIVDDLSLISGEDLARCSKSLPDSDEQRYMLEKGK